MTSARTRLQEEYEDVLFKVLLHGAAEHEGEALLREFQAVEESPDEKLSELALQRFTRKLATELKKRHKTTLQKTVFVAVRTVAISLAVATTLFISVMTTVPSFRVRVMNIWMDIQREHAFFQLGGNDMTNSSVTVTLTKGFSPTYIPKSYEITAFAFDDAMRRIVWENTGEKSFIIYTEEVGATGNIVVDTTDASRFEAISINSHRGTLLIKNSTVTIVWEQDGRLFTIKTQTDVETTIRVAKGVRFQE